MTLPRNGRAVVGALTAFFSSSSSLDGKGPGSSASGAHHFQLFVVAVEETKMKTTKTKCSDDKDEKNKKSKKKSKKDEKDDEDEKNKKHDKSLGCIDCENEDDEEGSGSSPWRYCNNFGPPGWSENEWRGDGTQDAKNEWCAQEVNGSKDANVRWRKNSPTKLKVEETLLDSKVKNACCQEGGRWSSKNKNNNSIDPQRSSTSTKVLAIEDRKTSEAFLYVTEKYLHPYRKKLSLLCGFLFHTHGLCLSGCST
ncbi:unnamed protein product [Amoebophrya sp. A120]|nr:unnamed protein product [Amoebophrya sp. A120]|eukprot:GSA120T00023648001.1